MRILAISNLYPPHGYGGYEWTCHDTMQRLAEHGHSPTVLTSTTTVPGATTADEPGVRRELTAWWDWEREIAVDGSLRKVAGIAWRNQRALNRALDDTKPDAVSLWHLGGMGLTVLSEVERRKIPIVAVIEDDWLVYGPSLDRWWLRVTAYRGFRRAIAATTGVATSPPTFAEARFAFASGHTRDRAVAEGRWKVNHASVIPLGVSTRDFPIVQTGERPWSWRVLYVGRMDPQKGLDTLLRAAAQLPDAATFELIGGGNESYRERLRADAATYGLSERVKFDIVPRGQLAARYRAADVVVFPSEWDEPFGLVPLEAMACGVPVIATGTGGSAEFLDDGVNCRLFRAGDADSLVAAVNELASDPDLRTALVRGGRATATRLTADKFADQIVALHEATVAGSVGPQTTTALRGE